MYNTIIVRIGEVAVKGHNRRAFEKKLIQSIKKALYGLEGYRVYQADGRLYVDIEPEILREACKRISNVFGVSGFSPATFSPAGYEELKTAVLQLCRVLYRKQEFKTFKVEVKRQNKNIEMTSQEMARELGATVLREMGDRIRVDVHQPDTVLYCEYRDAYNVTYAKKYDAVGGMPLGTAGKAMTLLSGGIDSPVATYLAAKRGLYVEAVHFHSFPFTSERSKEKIYDLANRLAAYTQDINIHMVNLLPIQKEIAANCPEGLMTILSRRFMMRIAERIAEQVGCNCIFTGESIAQVASQTIEGLTATNAVVEMLPVFRPLISLDKMEIIKIAERIGTYETSIIPEEDCCTVFLPKNPVTKPKLHNVERAEEKLDIEHLVQEAIDQKELVFTGGERKEF